MDRHLLPEEIDQLLDGELGFGTAPLKAHVRACEACRAELENARALVRQLEHLPHFTPSPQLAMRVMSQVQVFVPWHVALADSFRRLLPQSRPVRWVAAGALGSMALLFTVATVWALTRLDSIAFASELLYVKTRAGLMAMLSTAVTSMLGDDLAHTLGSAGVLGFVAMTALLIVAAGIAATALRAAAVRARIR